MPKFKVEVIHHDCMKGHWGAAAKNLVDALKQSRPAQQGRGWARKLKNRADWNVLMALKAALEHAVGRHSRYPKNEWSAGGSVMVTATSLTNKAHTFLNKLHEDRVDVARGRHVGTSVGWIRTGAREKDALARLEEVYAHVLAAIGD